MSKRLKLIILSVAVTIILTVFAIIMINTFGKEKPLIEVSVNRIEIEVNETFDLNNCFTITPNDASVNIMCYVTDATIANVTGDNIITGKSVGVTEILYKTKFTTGVYEETKITINVTEETILPESFSFEKDEVTLSFDMLSTTNKIVSTNNYNIVPTITYSNENICTYDYVTGKVYPIGAGETLVTVTFNKNGVTISNCFTVKIIESFLSISTNLTKSGNNYILLVENGNVENFSFNVFEEEIEVSTYKVVYSLEGNYNNINIHQFGFNICALEGLSIGECSMKIYLEDYPEIFVTIKIEVV